MRQSNTLYSTMSTLIDFDRMSICENVCFHNAKHTLRLQLRAYQRFFSAVCKSSLCQYLSASIYLASVEANTIPIAA